jgi:hypothetical protein
MKIKNTTYQNLWDTAKAVLRRKFIATCVYIKKIERSQINDPMLHLKLLGKHKEAEPRTSSRREIIKIRKNLMKYRQKNTKNQCNKNLVLRKIHKIDQPLVDMTKIRRKKTQISKIRNEKGGNNNHQGNPGNHQ